MIILSLRLREGMFERNIDFSPQANLIHSEKNSCGKTTLLRLILYALGFSIPNTKNIKFNKCEAELNLKTDAGKRMRLFRFSDAAIELSMDSVKKTFVLPDQQPELHTLIFGTNNKDILNNILGAFYLDQEKGWTLLNRGTVIGSIHFSIEELVRGISGIDCTDLIRKKSRISRDLNKYKEMFSIAQYRAAVEDSLEHYASTGYEELIDAEISALLFQKGELKKELRRIDKILSDNKRFRQFVTELKLLVQTPDGKQFVISENNIVGLNDSIDLLIAKRKHVSARYDEVSRQIEHLQKEQIDERDQLDFFQTASHYEIFDRQIVKIPMNQSAIKKEINRLTDELKRVNIEISNKTMVNNPIVSELSNQYVLYASELGLGDKGSIPPGYIFTSNLKILSGAILHKTAFAFRLAYIDVIKQKLGVKLPIILDSPSGKEIDRDNVRLMMNILYRYFSDHQIIIASIFNYDIENLKRIEIKDRLIDRFQSK